MMADRLVLDTNVLISAALTQTGTPRRVVDLVRARNGIILFSDETFAELRHRILGSKFDRYVPLGLHAAPSTICTLARRRHHPNRHPPGSWANNGRSWVNNARAG